VKSAWILNDTEVGSLVWVGYCSESASQVDVDIDVGVELCPNWLIQKELNSGKRFTILISLIAYHQLGLGRNAKSSNQIKELIMRSGKKSIHAITTWVRRQPPKVKAFLAVVSGMAALVLLRFIVHDHDNLFVAAEAVHSLGISVLIYKLIKEKTCAGSLTYPLPFFSLSFFLSISYLSISFICLQFPYNKFGLLCFYPLMFNLMWPALNIKKLFVSERFHWMINDIVWLLLFLLLLNEKKKQHFVALFCYSSFVHVLSWGCFPVSRLLSLLFVMYRIIAQIPGIDSYIFSC